MIINPISSISAFCSKHCDLARNLSMVALNTIMLASKIFKNVPSILSRSALVCLNVFSVYYWKDYEIPDWIKHVRDLRYAIHYHEVLPAFLTAARVFIKGLNILLSGGLFAAALIAFAGYPALMITMYGIMQPISLVGLLGTLSGEVIDYFENGRALAKLKEFERVATAKKIDDFVQCFLKLSHQSVKEKPPTYSDASVLHLALYSVRQFEQYNYYSFDVNRINKTTEEIFQLITSQLKTNQNRVDENVYLTCYNYLCIGIMKLYPDDLIKYVLSLSSSILFTIHSIRYPIHADKNS